MISFHQSAAPDRGSRIGTVLSERFAPIRIAVRDDSARHAGHAGASGAGETHYEVLLVSASFAGQSRVQRSRAVHAVLDAEFRSGLHALSLALRTPEEDAVAQRLEA